MTDETYQTKVYKDSGGDRQVIAAGGIMRMEPGSMIQYANPTGAADYYVDGNVSATGSGTIDSPFLTLAEAITASNTSIVLTANRWWARRNRIFVMGDQEIDEDLTIFPEKCDVIGLGYDVEAMPRIIGNHTIAAIATGKARGTRFFNCGFMEDAGGELLHLTTDHMAVEFYGCLFWPKVTGSTHCIRLADDNRAFKMIGCRIMEHAGAPGTGIFAECIKVEGTGQHDMVIKDNYMYGTEGIHIVASTGGYNGVIDNNLIRATVLTVNDASDLWIVSNNSLITAADANTITAAIVCNEDLAVNNTITHSGTDKSERYPLLKTT